MTDNHPITPPPELRQLWAQQAQRMDPRDPVAWLEHVATQAARWGADQELEACVEWMKANGNPRWAFALQEGRRPKPPSLKEQALAVLDHTPKGWGLAEVDLDTIRRALEALPD